MSQRRKALWLNGLPCEPMSSNPNKPPLPRIVDYVIVRGYVSWATSGDSLDTYAYNGGPLADALVGMGADEGAKLLVVAVNRTGDDQLLDRLITLVAKQRPQT